MTPPNPAASTDDIDARSGTATAIAMARGVGAAIVSAQGVSIVAPEMLADTLAAIERDRRPRWVWWSKATASVLVEDGLRPSRCWDLDAVHRLIHGGWSAGPGRVWAASHGLDVADVPASRSLNLFSSPADGDPSEPIRSDGHIDPMWIKEGWSEGTANLQRWAELALEVYHRQTTQLRQLANRPAAMATARSESVAELLCAELEHDGVPIDRVRAEALISSFVGPRCPGGVEQGRSIERDQLVLGHLPDALREGLDLRNPASVKALLRRAGIEVDDTRAWRLERLRHEHPIVDALLVWRKAERIATTFGYRWLDEHVADDQRWRGTWSGSDGAAGRMTATAGLHNLPADLRSSIAAEEGHVFVRADLGQIEPRILAAVSGDAALAAATADDDMYAPVARRLGVPREVAKVAVLGAMYGQTTGHGAAALRGLDAAYPVAMAFLADAARAAQSGVDLRTRGGRLVEMSSATDQAADAEVERSRSAARGRYGRNAMVQGAAAEFFKMWAVIVRARLPDTGRIVLCLHDELLVHARADEAERVVEVVERGLDETAVRWLDLDRRANVRFVADTSVVERWSAAH